MGGGSQELNTCRHTRATQVIASHAVMHIHTHTERTQPSCHDGCACSTGCSQPLPDNVNCPWHPLYATTSPHAWRQTSLLCANNDKTVQQQPATKSLQQGSLAQLGVCAKQRPALSCAAAPPQWCCISIQRQLHTTAQHNRTAHSVLRDAAARVRPAVCERPQILR